VEELLQKLINDLRRNNPFPCREIFDINLTGRQKQIQLQQNLDNLEEEKSLL